MVGDLNYVMSVGLRFVCIVSLSLLATCRPRRRRFNDAGSMFFFCVRFNSKIILVNVYIVTTMMMKSKDPQRIPKRKHDMMVGHKKVF